MASTSEYPFALMAAGIESRVRDGICLTRQEEEGCLRGAVIDLVFFPFRRHVEMLASD